MKAHVRAKTLGKHGEYLLLDDRIPSVSVRSKGQLGVLFGRYVTCTEQRVERKGTPLPHTGLNKDALFALLLKSPSSGSTLRGRNQEFYVI